MKKSKFSEAQIFAILKQGEAGVPVSELCREHGMSNATYCACYAWRSKYGGMDASHMAELQRLKRMYADLAMQNELIRGTLG